MWDLQIKGFAMDAFDARFFLSHGLSFGDGYLVSEMRDILVKIFFSLLHPWTRLHI